MDRKLLELLRCPNSGQSFELINKRELEEINQKIEGGKYHAQSGEAITEPLKQALITTDKQFIYRLDDGIPVLLPELAIVPVTAKTSVSE